MIQIVAEFSERERVCMSEGLAQAPSGVIEKVTGPVSYMVRLHDNSPFHTTAQGS